MGALTLRKRFCERELRLYEQDLGEPCGTPRLDAYVRRVGWSGRFGFIQPGVRLSKFLQQTLVLEAVQV